MARVRLEYESGVGSPASVVCKFPAADDSSAYMQHKKSDAAWMAGRCRREAEFYTHFGDALNIPRCLFADYRLDPPDAILVFEDLAAVGRQGDALHLCSPAEAAAVIDSAARIHALSGSELSGSQSEDDLPLRWQGDPGEVESRYRAAVPVFVERYGDRTPPEVLEIIKNLRPSSIQKEINALPLSLVHADLHLDNVFFRGRGNSTEAVILDWQSYGKGSGPLEIAQFLCISLSVKDRRASEADLLNRYHRRMADLGTSITVDELRTIYAWGILRRLWVIVVWLASADASLYSGREGRFLTQVFDDPALFDAVLQHGRIDKQTAFRQNGRP